MFLRANWRSAIASLDSERLIRRMYDYPCNVRSAREPRHTPKTVHKILQSET